MNDSLKYSHPIIISGMHRSGTSLLSRIIEKTGVFLGKYKQRNNESLYFLQLNRYIMSLNDGSSWDNPKKISKKDNFLINEISLKIQPLLNNRKNYLYYGKKALICRKSFFYHQSRWGWKDPRNIFTIPIWKNIFPNSKIIIIKRHPIDVYQSLAKRSLRKNMSFLMKIYNFNIFKLVLTGFKSLKKNKSKSLNLIEICKLYYEMILELENNYPQDIYVIKYEDLLINTKETCIQLFKFLNTDIHNKDTDFIKQNIYPMIDKSRAYAYRKNLKIKVDKQMHSLIDVSNYEID